MPFWIEGPYSGITSDINGRSNLAARTRLPPLSLTAIEAAYVRATAFFIERKDVLVRDYGWKVDKTRTAEQTHGEIFALTSSIQYSNGYGPVDRHIRLPKTFSAFLDLAQVRQWEDMFGHWWSSYADLEDTSDVFVDPPPPLADIFFLLQILSPGLLWLYIIDLVYDTQIQIILPQEKWLKEHAEELVFILGNNREYKMVLEAVERKKGFESKSALVPWG